MPKYRNIMVAVDGSEPGKRSFKRAVEQAKENGAKLIIVHIAPSYLTPYEEERDAERGRKLLEEYETLAQNEGVQVEPVLRLGNPRHLIPKELAKEYDVDLIVCGSQGLNAFEYFLLGSVSESIARHAQCDVLIVR